MGQSNTAEVAEEHPAVQDLAFFARHIIWDAGCAEIIAGCAVVTTGSWCPCGAATKERPLDNREHHVGGSDAKNQ